jgi:hypothetical protein
MGLYHDGVILRVKLIFGEKKMYIWASCQEAAGGSETSCAQPPQEATQRPCTTTNHGLNNLATIGCHSLPIHSSVTCTWRHLTRHRDRKVQGFVSELQISNGYQRKIMITWGVNRNIIILLIICFSNLVHSRTVPKAEASG